VQRSSEKDGVSVLTLRRREERRGEGRDMKDMKDGGGVSVEMLAGLILRNRRSSRDLQERDETGAVM